VQIVYIKYGELYREDPVLARRKVVELYKETRNSSLTGRICSTDRSVIRRVVRRYRNEGEDKLKDRSKRPKTSPYKTHLHIKGMILAEREKTGYGRDRIARNLQAKGIEVRPPTVRYVLKRYKVKAKYKRTRYRKKQRYYVLKNYFP
jgi:transposase